MYSSVNTIWVLFGTALVFFMQAGFSLCEAGFTRAKNTGNILMKNLMDFCIGTVVFILIGFSLLLGEDIMGLIGKPGLDIISTGPNLYDVHSTKEKVSKESIAHMWSYLTELLKELA